MFRDVIIVDKSERDFINLLRKVNELLKKNCRGLLTTCISGLWSNFWVKSNHIIRITLQIGNNRTVLHSLESTSQCSLWTNLNGVLFGPHWFQIRNLTISQNVVNIHLQFLRYAVCKLPIWATFREVRWFWKNNESVCLQIYWTWTNCSESTYFRLEFI